MIDAESFSLLDPNMDGRIIRPRQFDEKRDAMLETIEYDTIVNFMKSYDMMIPEDPITLLVGAHKTRAGLRSMPARLREESRRWLKENGFGDQRWEQVDG